MNIVFYDPGRAHQYLSDMFFDPMKLYMAKALHQPVIATDILEKTHNAVVLTLADHLNLDTVNQLKNNNCKIVGFSVTDSSYISQSCREAAVLSKIDLMFMLTGIQKINEGHEMVVDRDFRIGLEKRQFLPEEDWAAFNLMRISGRLKSLPYVHWQRQPEVEAKPYNLRSQKVLIRGGHHMRRFILALKLMERDLLDINSGFITSPYFQDDMNPQFRYCDACRAEWKKNKMMSFDWMGQCTCEIPPISDLGKWNNKSPRLFYDFTRVFEKIFSPQPPVIENQLNKLLNARWLSAEDHLKMLARITFTSDLKWLFSIYAPQRFWDAAMVGCVNLLPHRTIDQDFFPDMNPGEHYLTFHETFALLNAEARIEEALYNEISANAKSIYDQWMRPTAYAINTNLLKHIFSCIEAIQ